jgi:hypothetical protein
MKKLPLISLLVLICSCTSNYKYFALKENILIPDGYKIYVGKVNVNLSEEKMAISQASSNEYPNKEELDKIFKDKIIYWLKQSNLYSSDKNNENVFEADFDINYVRVFMAFTSDRYVGSRLDGYQIDITKNKNIIAIRNNRERYTVNHGLVGNFKKIGKILSLSADKNDELKEVNAFIDGIAGDLTRLGK